MFSLIRTYRNALLIIAFCTLGFTSKAQEAKSNPLNKFIGFFKKSNYVIAPLVAYKPVTNWQFGVGVKYLYRPTNYDSTDTRKSFVASALIYTLNNQLLFNPYFVHFFNHEAYMLDGYYGIKKFPQNYYGIGSQSLDANQETVDLSEIKIEQLAFKKLKGNLFGGVGLRLIGAINVQQEQQGLLIKDKPSGWDGFWAIGPSANIRLDDRDNILNARKGQFIDVRLEFMNQLQHSSSGYTNLKIDTRKYFTPFQNKKKVIAGQLYMQTALKGDIPFSEMAFVGSETLMRGYYDKRYIDRHFIGGQVEYRQELPYNFGFVTFAGLGDVTDQFSNIQLSNLKYSLGAGIRYKIIPKEDINIRLDFGIGRESNTFYLSIAEAF